MGRLIEDPDLRDKRFVFEDRQDAGKRLAEFLESHRGSNTILLAVPSGGVPVAAEAARLLSLPVDLLIVRKLQIPYNPEAGFGAMTLSGEILLNEELVRSLGLGEDAITATVKLTREVLDRRNILFRKGMPLPSCGGRRVIIIDDGLASGYTMRVAARWVKSMGPKEVIVAVPTGSERTVTILGKEVDEVVCLNVRSGYRFAVAEAYRQWYDLSDEEVLRIMASISG